MTTCIESKRAITTNGYSRIYQNGSHIQAHRWAWELLHGKIPAGLVIDHLCSNRKCVAPDHLRMVTQGENIRAGKHSIDNQTHCKQGHEWAKHLWIRPTGRRECGECNRVRSRRKR